MNFVHRENHEPGWLNRFCGYAKTDLEQLLCAPWALDMIHYVGFVVLVFNFELELNEKFKYEWLRWVCVLILLKVPKGTNDYDLVLLKNVR